MQNDIRLDVIKQVHKITKSNVCILKNVICECKSNGKLPTEKNHVISKSSYLKSISNQNRVMVFDIQQKDYYRNGGLLQEKNINNVNVRRVFCGRHDTLLFDEIENGKIFDDDNNKQCFQFAFRAFIFHYSDALVKQNFKLVHPFFERIGKANCEIEAKWLERFKKDFQSEKWNDIESKVIRLKQKIGFVSCFYTRPIWGINKNYITCKDKIAFNIFPQGEDTVVLMSYFKGSSKAIVKYCNEINKYAEEGNEKKLIQYLTTIIIACDPHISLNPLLWNKFSESEKENFYEFAHLLKKNNRSLIGIIKKVFKLNFKRCKCNLFL